MTPDPLTDLRSGIDDLRERLATALCQTGHPLSPLAGDAIPCGFHLIRADDVFAALGPDAARMAAGGVGVTDIDAALAATSPATETARTVVSSDRPCRRHQWVINGYLLDGTRGDFCRRCERTRDMVRSRRGRSSRRLGGDQERRIERVYGPRKVGEYGDAIDLLGRDFAWQSKATRDPMPEWLRVIDEPVSHMPTSLVALSAAAMLPILGGRHPLVIQSWVSNGLPTRDRIWVRGEDWRTLHGGAWNAWLVMSGEHFLVVHGRDEPA